MWRPALLCGNCSYPNDDCFKFCQQCGSSRHQSPVMSPSQIVPIDIESIDSRIAQLNRTRSTLPYQKQKTRLELELQCFLNSLAFPKSVLSASPQDVVRFLIWKDSAGRTQVHAAHCPFLSRLGRQECPCPTRLAAGTVDTFIGKLRSIFNSHGRVGTWDEFSVRGNPAAHHSVKDYLQSVQREQAQARVPSKQAVPLFLDKFQKLVRHLRFVLQDPTVPPTARYIYARDLAFFTLSFSSGDRASDLGRVKTVDVLEDSDGKNLVIHQRIGKTLRGRKTRVIPIRLCSNPVICPVKNLRFYVQYCRAANIDISTGYLFRPTSPTGCVLDAPFLASSVHGRLTMYLKELGIYDGESPHSFRSGTAIMLRLLGASKEDVARHVGWQSTQMVDLYTQTDKVLGISSSTPTPASNPLNMDDEVLMERISSEFRGKNLLLGYRSAFVNSC